MTRPKRTSKLRTAGLLACAALLVGTCGGGERPAGTAPPSANPAVEPTSVPSPASSVPGGYEHSELEQQLIDAMAATGVVDPGIDEKGFNTAIVSGMWGTRRAWAHAYLSPDAGTPGEVVDEVAVDGVPGQVVRTEGFGDVLTFACGDVGYQVTVLGADWQVVTDSVARATTFAEALMPQLKCTG